MGFPAFLQAALLAFGSVGQQQNQHSTTTDALNNNNRKTTPPPRWVDEQGKIAGLDVGLPVLSAQDLARKLTFLHLEDATGMNPFAGLQVLKSLPPSPGQNLLLAAEYSRFFPDQAEEHLQKYFDSPPKKPVSMLDVLVNSNGQRKKDRHPIAVLVSDRVQVQPIEDNQKDGAKPFQSLVETEYADLLTTEEKIASGLVDMDAYDKEMNCDLESQKQPLDVRMKELDARFKDVKAFAALGEFREQIDLLENLVGLQNVKEAILDHAFFRLWAAPGNHKLGQRTHFCLVGGPGSGKTTAGKILANVLYDLGERQGITRTYTEETFGNYDTDRFDGRINRNDCILLLDNAHKIDTKNSKYGKANLEILTKTLQTPPMDFWCVITGEEEELNNEFFSFNNRLRSHFQVIHCDDFTVDEIEEIFVAETKKGEWNTESEHVPRAAAKLLAKDAGTKEFGNVYTVRRFLQQCIQRAVLRNKGPLSKKNQTLTMADVGLNDITIDGNPNIDRILQEINGMVGWSRVKQNVQDLVQLCKVNERRKEKDQAQLDVVMNRVFLGNPGTGKTSCAKLYAQLLKELGLLSGGEVVEKTASDLIGSAIGESQNKANDVLQEARGNVLIIDEAHTLNDATGNYGKQVLDTIVEKVSGSADDDMAVLLLGYEEGMLQMLRDCNPGLSRRFPKDQAFYFDDYSDGELLEILLLKAKEKQCKVSVNFAEKAIQILSLQRNAANFGNAGAVETMIKAAFASATKRDAVADVFTLEACDIPDSGTERAAKDKDPLQSLDKLYQMDSVKNKLDQMRKAWEVALREGDELPSVGHFVFDGSPGTGKTTVARSLARILHALGLIPSNRILETSALELTGEFIGQTKTKVTEKLREAKGGILFIDEAYNLGSGSYGKEARDTLVGAMTSEEYKDVVIVLAGYTNEMNRMLQTNSGLRSRFTNFIPFADWVAEDCGKFFEDLANRNGFSLEPDVASKVTSSCESLMKFPGWANGRDVVKLFGMVKKYRSERVFEGGSVSAKEIMASDVDAAIAELRASRAGGMSLRRDLTSRDNEDEEMLAPADALDVAPETKTSEDIASSDDEEEDEDEVDEPDEMTDEELFEKLKALSACPQGFAWNREGDGWRCEGGSHFVTEAELRRSFMKDA